MNSWQVQDAKARFSELLDTTIEKGSASGNSTRNCRRGISSD